MFPYIYIFGSNVSMYNICAMSGFLIAVFMFLRRTKGVFPKDVQDSIIAVLGADIPFVIAGAILHNKFSFADSIGEFFDILFKDTGIAFLGGLTGGLIGFRILFPLLAGRGIPMIKAMEALVPSMIAGHAMGRIGCLLGGCCYGKPSGWGVVYQAGTPAYEAYGATRLFPVPAAEAALLFILLLVILAIGRNAVSIYFIGYSIIRFSLEFLRGDVRGKTGFLSPAQKICTIMFLLTIYMKCAIHKKRSLQNRF